MAISELEQRMRGLSPMKISIQDIDRFWVSECLRQFPPPSRPLAPLYRVGEPLQEGRQRWPVGSQYAHGQHGHELTLFLPHISDQCIADVKRGEAEFALVAHHPLLLLAYRFGQSIPWSDAPYCWHMQPAHCRVLPPREPSEARSLLWVTLVGAHDGIIHAQRGLTLLPIFSRQLNQLIHAQASVPFVPEVCFAAIISLLIDLPSTVDRLPLALARSRGNQ
jgi:hypothetical protein